MSQDSFDPPVVVKIYKTYQILGPLLNDFPKPYRYSLGQSIDRSVLAILEFIFEANALAMPLREPPLLKAHAKCELAKILIRLCSEMNIIGNTQYFQLMANLQEVSKMLVGWIKYIRTQPSSQRYKNF